MIQLKECSQNSEKDSMYYAKKGSRVVIGNAGIPALLIDKVLGTLCFEVENLDNPDKHQFVDISLTREQMERLQELLVWYLSWSTEHPPAESRPSVPHFNYVPDEKTLELQRRLS